MSAPRRAVATRRPRRLKVSVRSSVASTALELPEAQVVDSVLDLSRRQLLKLALPPSLRDAFFSLTTLDVSRNRLRTLPDEALDALPCLESLDCSYNLLRSLGLSSGRSLPASLVRVDASRNLVARIGNALSECVDLRIAVLSHNCIALVDGLEHLRALEELDLAGNRVKSGHGLRPLACNGALRALRPCIV